MLQFFTGKVAGRYKTAKSEIIKVSIYVETPHCVNSYILLLI